ncbi:uncharacterized protein LOC110020612 [Phalaenopsis equestris]|uniref:uncharacterized protein LOC110020612 n=1 Tax=Phalaenopsis equestris TaxID=78828 RepID=UPI0009E3ABDE|nr:uncharacterized protein LOC110020612 [Phalaenopsis equestris]
MEVSPAAPKPKFSVYQNPAFSAALNSTSLRPSTATLLLISASFLAASVAFLTMSSWEEVLVKRLAGFDILTGTTFLVSKALHAAIALVFLATLSAFIRALSVLNVRKALAASSSKKATENQKILTDRQLRLLGLKPKPTDKSEKSDSVKMPPMSKSVSSPPMSEPLVPIRSSASNCTPRSLRSRSDQQISSAGRNTVVTAKSPSSTPYKYASSPAIPWSRHSPGSAKGILTEEKLEEFLADVDEKIKLSEAKAEGTLSPTVSGFGIVSPSSILSSSNASGAARSTPLRPVRLSPGSLQKYSPPKKGEGEVPPPMSLEQTVEAFENLGVYPQIEQWRDCLRQWFSSVLVKPLLDKIGTSHILVMQAAASHGANITISQVGSEPNNTTMPVNASPVYEMREWQPTVTLDEDGFLHQLHASLVQARDRSVSWPPVSGQQQQQIALLPLIQQCLDAISEHQRLKTLMKAELIKGLLPQSTVPAEFTVHRVRELAEGSCLKNFDYIGHGAGFDKTVEKWTTDVPSDSYLLLYLFCAFLEHPKWMLHVDPTSYSGAQSSKNPLFLGVLPPKDRFPEKYVAIISGVPSIIHPGACVLSIGKQRPPIFSLYWDTKLQFSIQGRTALWDAILLLCHRIKVGYDGVVRGVHLGSSAFNILPIFDSETDS